MKDIAFFFYPVLLKDSDRTSCSSEDAEDARRALDCLIFHHDSSNERAIPGSENERDDSSIVGENFLTASFVEATKVALSDIVQFAPQEYLIDNVVDRIVEYSMMPLFHRQDCIQDVTASPQDYWNAFTVSISLSLEDPFSMIPYVINVFKPTRILEESITIYHSEPHVEDALLPLNFVDLFRKPLLSDDTMASLTFAMDSAADEFPFITSTSDESAKPLTLAAIAEAGKTFTSLADLESELDLILD